MPDSDEMLVDASVIKESRSYQAHPVERLHTELVVVTDSSLLY